MEYLFGEKIPLKRRIVYFKRERTLVDSNVLKRKCLSSILLKNFVCDLILCDSWD